MEHIQLAHFRELLLAQKEKLEEEIKKLETPPAFENVPGDEDEVDESTDYFNTTASALDLRKELEHIAHALLKIENGEYGVCEATGKEIPAEVLEVNPAALYHPEYQRKINE
jgi:RNA polymerase-binding transcription factor DksA